MKGFFSPFNHKTLYLTIPITCRKNLNKSDLADCKIITIERETKALLVECPDYCHSFEIL